MAPSSQNRYNVQELEKEPASSWNLILAVRLDMLGGTGHLEKDRPRVPHTFANSLIFSSQTIGLKFCIELLEENLGTRDSQSLGI